MHGNPGFSCIKSPYMLQLKIAGMQMSRGETFPCDLRSRRENGVQDVLVPMDGDLESGTAKGRNVL